MTIDELIAATGLTANDEIPIWDAEATGEPTKKITAQQLATAIVALASLVTSVNGETGAVTLTAEDVNAKAVQTPVANPTASGNAVAFIDSISQNAQGVIVPTKKTVPNASTMAPGLMSAADKVKLDDISGEIADKASAIVDTASGAIASFPDGAAVPAKDITIGIEPVQAGSGDPSPTNVRPISGWTGANVTRTGKNLLKITAQSTTTKGVTFTVNNDGTVTAVGTATGGSAFLNLGTVKLLAGTYILSGDTDGERSKTNFYIQRPGETHDYSLPFTLTEEKEFNAYIAVFNGNTVDQIFYPQIEFGSTATAYKPYTGTTYPISWQSEAGTIYGGTLDVTTGLLTVTMAEVDLGTLTWVKGNRNIDDTGYVFSASSITGTAKANENIICSSLIPLIPRVGTWEKVPANHIEIDAYKYLIVSAEYPDAASFKAAMSGVQLVYELATPQTYQLTPVEIEMLLGDNNVWADTGDSTVTYRADTKLYIQKINAPTDDDMIADAQIASGRYFIIGGNLYRSTTTIPAGDAITPGTNCILTNLADALNALNT